MQKTGKLEPSSGDVNANPRKRVGWKCVLVQQAINQAGVRMIKSSPSFLSVVRCWVARGTRPEMICKLRDAEQPDDSLVTTFEEGRGAFSLSPGNEIR
jgi:hypothetical protein